MSLIRTISPSRLIHECCLGYNVDHFRSICHVLERGKQPEPSEAIPKAWPPVAVGGHQPEFTSFGYRSENRMCKHPNDGSPRFVNKAWMQIRARSLCDRPGLGFENDDSVLLVRI